MNSQAQYATREEWRNNSRKNKETEQKQKQQPVVDVKSDAVRNNITWEPGMLGS